MKKIISLLLAVVLILSTFPRQTFFAASISSEVKVGNSGYLSDEIAEKFVKLFYSQSAISTDRVKNILTGKENGTVDEIKEICEDATSFFDLLDSDTIEHLSSKIAADTVNGISRLLGKH